MTRGLVIRSRELNGKIVTLGDSHGRGIVVESPDLSANDWGSESAQFVLKRSPRVQWPDLRGNAPILVEDRGTPVWRGRIKQTPMTDGGLARSISVNAEGQQFRLDDDVYERNYAHTSLTDWVDVRSVADAALANYQASGVVQASDGVLLIEWPESAPVAANQFTGVTYDFGPSLCKRVVISYTSSNNSPTPEMYCRGQDTNDGGVAGPNDDAFTIVNNASPGGILRGTFATARRYVSIFMFNPGGGFIPGSDQWFRIVSVQLFSSTGYESGDHSILLASGLANDALDRASMQLSTDRSLISGTSFFIPEFSMGAPATPREVINGANAFHDYQFRVRADNRPEYRPRPAVPLIEVGSDSQFNEASAGDASEVYSTVIVVYTDEAGSEQRVTRNQTATLQQISGLQLLNPSATVNNANWTSPTARDTGIFDSSPASFNVPVSGFPFFYGYVTSNAWTAGTWVPGRGYILSGSVRLDNPDPIYPARITLYDGTTGAEIGAVVIPPVVANTWVPFSIPYIVQTAVPPTVAVQFNGLAASNGWFDTLVNTEATATVIDQWGFKRTKVLETGMTLTPAGAQQIADTFLLGHRTTPLKGSLVVTGDGRARRMPSGQPMRCSDLLESVGELVRLRHLVDPETGKVGRIGRIAAVSWDAAANVATIEIDSTTKNFEAMLARLAIVTSQVRN